ncbi:hypothetical protein ACF0H5_005383 [Mactra antiquata]
MRIAKQRPFWSSDWHWVDIGVSPGLLAINNVALGKPAFQSSTHNAHEASKAVDGNINGDPDAGYCMHTSDGSDEFWEVDLGELYIIDHVKVYNRIGSYGEKFSLSIQFNLLKQDFDTGRCVYCPNFSFTKLIIFCPLQ